MRFDGRDRLYVRGTLEDGVLPNDAFGRLRVANPFSQFDSQFQYDLQPIIWEAITASGGTVAHVPATASALLSVPAALNASAALQTYQYFRYFPGRGHEVFMTFVLAAAVAGVRKRVGYFDSADGVYLEQNSTTDVAITLRSSSPAPVETRAAQSAWNVDKFDGSGPSGVTLDFSKGQILYITAQWLGIGRVEVGFDVAGVQYPAHRFDAANVVTAPYTRTFNLPLRYEITNLTGANPGSFNAVCCTLINSGTPDLETAYHFGDATVAAAKTVAAGAELFMVAIRPAATFNAIANRMLVVPETAIFLGGSNPVRVRVLWNPTVTGGAWGAVNAASSVEINIGAATIAGGTPMDVFYVAGSAVNRSTGARALSARYPFCLNAAASLQIPIAIVAQSVGGNSDCYAGFTWRELR